MAKEKKFPEIGKDSVVHRGAAKDTLTILPDAPDNFTNVAKKHFEQMGKWLIKIDRLKETYLPALGVFALAMEQHEFATDEINRKNQLRTGSGYIQKFSTGATNISAEVTLRRDAEKTILQCCKQFGLDPKSDKELKAEAPAGYGDLFSQFLNGTK